MSFFLSKESPALSKQTFNELILKLKGNIKLSKVATIHKLDRNAKRLKEKYTKSEELKKKNEAKANRLIEQVTFLKSLHISDLTTLVAVFSKSLEDVGKNVDARMEERALCNVSIHKEIIKIHTDFRSKYPNWFKEVPDIIKGLGLLYRKKRLDRYKKAGKLDDFLEREKRLFRLLHEIIGLDIDAKLLEKGNTLSKKLKVKKGEKKDVAKKKGSTSEDKLETSIDDDVSLNSDSEADDDEIEVNVNNESDIDSDDEINGADSEIDENSSGDEENFDSDCDNSAAQRDVKCSSEEESEDDDREAFNIKSLMADSPCSNGKNKLKLNSTSKLKSEDSNKSNISSDKSNSSSDKSNSSSDKSNSSSDKSKSISKEKKIDSKFSSRNKGTASVKKVNLLSLLKTGQNVDFEKSENVYSDEDDEEFISLRSTVIKTESPKKLKKGEKPNKKRKIPNSEPEVGSDDDIGDYDNSSKYFKRNFRQGDVSERGSRRGVGGRGRGDSRGRGRGDGRGRGRGDSRGRGRGDGRSHFEGDRQNDNRQFNSGGRRMNRGGPRSRGGRGDFNGYQRNEGRDDRRGRGKWETNENPNRAPLGPKQAANRGGGANLNIHPSWAAKKAADIAIGTFQGKKTVFDD